MKALNIKEAKELIDTYNKISIKTLPKEIIQGKTINNITGFGHVEECKLCISIHQTCDKCIYKTFIGCIYNNEESYDKIKYANTPLKLVRAVRARARYIQSIIDSI